MDLLASGLKQQSEVRRGMSEVKPKSVEHLDSFRTQVKLVAVKECVKSWWSMCSMSSVAGDTPDLYHWVHDVPVQAPHTARHYMRLPTALSWWSCP